MAYTHTVPAGWDVGYLCDKVGVSQFLGQGTSEGATTVSFSYAGTVEQFEAMTAAIETYEVDYFEDVTKPDAINKVADIRWEKQKFANFNGATLPCDDTTIGRITAAAYLMESLPSSAQTRKWKIPGDPDTWITVDRDALLAMGEAIASHMQTCFDREDELCEQISALTDQAGLDAIDINAGWPA